MLVLLLIFRYRVLGNGYLDLDRFSIAQYGKAYQLNSVATEIIKQIIQINDQIFFIKRTLIFTELVFYGAMRNYFDVFHSNVQ